MALRQFHDMSHDDEQLYELSKGMPDDYEPPEYPNSLQFTISQKDLERAGADGGDIGDTMRFSALAEVTSIFKGMDHCRIELQIDEFAGEDGKFFDPSFPGCICLCDPELEKLGLEADCERGDMIHLIGSARLESSSSTEWGGDMVTMQITELTYAEDESTESREG